MPPKGPIPPHPAWLAAALAALFPEAKPDELHHGGKFPRPGGNRHARSSPAGAHRRHNGGPTYDSLAWRSRDSATSGIPSALADRRSSLTPPVSKERRLQETAHPCRYRMVGGPAASVAVQHTNQRIAGAYPSDTARVTDRLVRAAPIGMVALALGFAACTHGGDGSATERSSTTTSATRATPTTITVPAASSSTTSTSRLGLASVDWARVAYPIDCGSMLQGKVGTQVLQVAYAQPAPDAELALVMVACQAGAGTPPRTIFVFDGAISAISKT